MKYKYILFDLDGTLIDTNTLIIDSFKHTYKTHLDRDIDEKEILQYFGEPLITTLRRYSPENAEELYDTYINYNESIHDNSVSLCCNIKECLEQLKEIGCVMAVVTSKRSKMAHQGLELFDIMKYFTEVITVDDTTEHKPHPAPVLKALEKLGAAPEEAIMVGDSIFDIQCAHNAGVKAIQVAWGAALEHLEQEPPDFLVDNALEIVDIARGEELSEDAESAEAALLMTVKDELQANIIESLLKVYEIPMRRVFKGNDVFGKIVMGLTVNGIDLYVPSSALLEARGLIENSTPVGEEQALEAAEDDKDIESMKERYDKKRVNRARISLLFFIPGIVILAGVAIYWLVSLLVR
ncbi:MAG: HAD-superfamily hydrolase, subfamily variant 1 [Clostridia bacterium]|nr:HAD-superfamily hydrolase, subfamily variant 1 [Clostridia bacterium]